jgi:NitT/TauT family transport system substrate-binding protein
VRRLVPALFAVPLLLAACGGGDDDASDTPSGAEDGAEEVTLHLGYFPNLTHAPALVGVQEGLFEANLPDNVTLEIANFNAGPEAVDALIAGDLDITYIGPNPSINSYAQSDGELTRVIAGATSGGAALVVREGIDTIEQLAGTTLATPQLGNTQDVALRAFLADNGFETDTAGGGDVSIQPQANGDALAAFIDGQIDGAWVPEPFATRFQLEGNGHVLVDEAELWPNGQFVTTDVLVRTAFLEDHPDVVEAFLRGHLAALQFIEDDPDAAKSAANAEIEAISGSPLSAEVLDAAWENLEFTHDPIASSLRTGAEQQAALGFIDPVDLDEPGLYDLTILNRLLEEAGDPVVAAA